MFLSIVYFINSYMYMFRPHGSILTKMLSTTIMYTETVLNSLFCCIVIVVVVVVVVSAHFKLWYIPFYL